MLDLYVYDRDIELIGVVDKQSQIMWERRFYSAGYFQISAPFTENNSKLLNEGNIVMRGDAVESGIIRYSMKTRGAETAEITAIGRFLSYLLHGHIVKRHYTAEGNAETAMRELVTLTVMDDSNEEYIPEIDLGEIKHCTGTVSQIDVSYMDLHEALKEISRLSGTGCRLTLDPNTKRLMFECYDGRDFSVSQTENPQVVFSQEYDTVISEPTMTVDDSETVNAVVGRYYGEYGEVVVEYNPSGARGRGLREIVFRGDCVTVEVMGQTVLDRGATRRKLLTEAQQKTRAKTEQFSAGVAHTGSLVYKKSYDIGDIVTVGDSGFGVFLNRRIHKVTENYTAAGVEIVPTLDDINPAEITEE